MVGSPHILSPWQTLAQGLTPLERFRGMGEWFGNRGDHGSVSTLLTISLVVVLAGLLALLIAGRLDRRRRGRTFQTHAAGTGLSLGERQVLAYIARMAGLKDPEAIFTLEDAFRNGAIALMNGPRVHSLPKEKQVEVAALIDSLAAKLGFSCPLTPSQQNLAASTRMMHAGDCLSLALRHGPGVDAAVDGAEPNHLVVTVSQPTNWKEGQAMLGHFSKEGTVWEFDTDIVSIQGKKLLLRHSNNIRFINRRKFPRVPMRRAALVAEFCFFQDGNMESPNFVPASLLELAGPGLLLEAPIDVALGKRVLVVVRFSADSIVRAGGWVRRRDNPKAGLTEYAVELTDLRPEELAELARQTNDAVHEEVQVRLQPPEPAPQPATA